MSSFTQLVDAITSRAALLEEPPENRADLGYLFIRALRKTVNEVHRGAKADDFTDLTVINLIIMGADEGYTAEEMRDFISQLRNDEN